MCVYIHLNVFTGSVAFLLGFLLYKSFQWFRNAPVSSSGLSKTWKTSDKEYFFNHWSELTLRSGCIWSWLRNTTKANDYLSVHLRNSHRNHSYYFFYIWSRTEELRPRHTWRTKTRLISMFDTGAQMSWCGNTSVCFL